MTSAQDKTRTILFVCNDHIGRAMAGPGIRYWEMAHALQRKGHEAVILSQHFESGFPKGPLTYAGRASLFNLIRWIWRADQVVQSGRPLPIFLARLFRRKMIFDQYDPVIFEYLERNAGLLRARFTKGLMLLLWKIRQRIVLCFGDAFLVANERQRDFLTGQLAILGYTAKMDRISVMPFGLPAEKPVKRNRVLRGTTIKDSDFLLVWGGGIWDWFDPRTLLHAMAVIQQTRDDIKVFFPGLKPPSPYSRKMTVVDAFLGEAESLGLLGKSVIVNREWSPYEQRADYLLEADAGISLHRASLEMRFAFRTRMLDYVWAGLPIIASAGDCWADLVEKRGLGLIVPPKAADALVSAILTMAQDDALRKRCREQVRLIANEYKWERLVDRLPLFSNDR